MDYDDYDIEQASSREVAARFHPPALASAVVCPLSIPRTHAGAKAREGAAGTLACLLLHPQDNTGSHVLPGSAMGTLEYFASGEQPKRDVAELFYNSRLLK